MVAVNEPAAPSPRPDGREPVRSQWVPVAAVALLGGMCAAALGRSSPSAHGAQRLVAPETLLPAFDVVLVLLLCRPGRRDVWGSVALACVGVPFHAAIAAAAGAAPGFHAAFALVAGAWMAASLVAVSLAPRLGAMALAGATFALPLAAYALAEFGRVPTRALVAASPLTGPVLLARDAAAASAGDAVPALAACAAVVGVAAFGRRRAAGATP